MLNDSPHCSFRKSYGPPDTPHPESGVELFEECILNLLKLILRDSSQFWLNTQQSYLELEQNKTPRQNISKAINRMSTNARGGDPKKQPQINTPKLWLAEAFLEKRNMFCKVFSSRINIQH